MWSVSCLLGCCVCLRGDVCEDGVAVCMSGGG